MITAARRTYLTGSIGFIAIGLLHTITHLLELSGQELEQRFDDLGMIDVSGPAVSSWDLFQGTSLLMGLFSMAIGFGSIGGLLSVGRTSPPPVGTCITNVLTLASIMTIGALYLGAAQIWGGLFGIVMFTPGIAAHLLAKDQG